MRSTAASHRNLRRMPHERPPEHTQATRAGQVARLSWWPGGSGVPQAPPSPSRLTGARQTDRSSDICAAEDRITCRGFTVRLENDLFVGTDQSYTNGVALLGISRDIAETVRPECLPSTVRWHASLIKWLDPGFWANADHPPGVQNVVVKFGQSMYTPADPQRVDLIDNDRPYAGLLYVGMSWNRRSVDEPTSTDTLDTREITLGVIGPRSLARQAQNLVHDAIGANRFLGWDHQIQDRTGPSDGDGPQVQAASQSRGDHAWALRPTRSVPSGCVSATSRRRRRCP